jgi:hypothetical protein
MSTTHNRRDTYKVFEDLTWLMQRLQAMDRDSYMNGNVPMQEKAQHVGERAEVHIEAIREHTVALKALADEFEHGWVSN